jgi:hypothetical protein
MTNTKSYPLHRWAADIKDHKLHIIGEYYCIVTGKKSYHTISGGYTKPFNDWLIKNDSYLSEEVPKIINEFEVLRDMYPLGFFIRRK